MSWFCGIFFPSVLCDPPLEVTEHLSSRVKRPVGAALAHVLERDSQLAINKTLGGEDYLVPPALNFEIIAGGNAKFSVDFLRDYHLAAYPEFHQYWPVVIPSLYFHIFVFYAKQMLCQATAGSTRLMKKDRRETSSAVCKRLEDCLCRRNVAVTQRSLPIVNFRYCQPRGDMI